MSELRRYLDRLAGRWLVVVALVAVGAGVGALYTWLAPPSYRSSTLVVATELQPGGDRRDVSFGQAYGRLVDQQTVLASAADSADITVDQARGAITSSTSPDSPMIEITGVANSPDQAANVVNAAAGAIVDIASARIPDTGVRLVVVSPGLPPDSPVSPDLLVDLAVGAAVGLLLGGFLLLGNPRPRSAGAGPDPSLPSMVPARAADPAPVAPPAPFAAANAARLVPTAAASDERNGTTPSPRPRD